MHCWETIVSWNIVNRNNSQITIFEKRKNGLTKLSIGCIKPQFYFFQNKNFIWSGHCCAERLDYWICFAEPENESVFYEKLRSNTCNFLARMDLFPTREKSFFLISRCLLIYLWARREIPFFSREEILSRPRLEWGLSGSIFPREEDGAMEIL